jgi:hypothetical protein
MDKVLEWMKDRLLTIFIIITVIGFICIFFGDDKNIIPEMYSALDTASAVALAVLAFVAYYDYSKDKQNAKRFLEQLEKVDELKSRDALVGIQFGGGNSEAHIDMKKFAKDKNINEDLIMIQAFGDESNNVSPSDIPKLEDYLKHQVIPMLSGADKIHLIISGAGIAYYPCADIFSNWKPIIVYQRNKQGKYEAWYTDNKHREKVESSLKNV